MRTKLKRKKKKLKRKKKKAATYEKIYSSL